MARDLLGLFALPPDRLVAALALLSLFLIACEYARQGLLFAHPRSRAAHVAACLLTCVVQPVALAVGLAVSAARHPEAAWINLGYAAALYGVWYAAGWTVRWARPDAQGPDAGFMAVGALITFPVGAVAALVA